MKNSGHAVGFTKAGRTVIVGKSEVSFYVCECDGIGPVIRRNFGTRKEAQSHAETLVDADRTAELKWW